MMTHFFLIDADIIRKSQSIPENSMERQTKLHLLMWALTLQVIIIIIIIRHFAQLGFEVVNALFDINIWQSEHRTSNIYPIVREIG